MRRALLLASCCVLVAGCYVRARARTGPPPGHYQHAPPPEPTYQQAQPVAEPGYQQAQPVAPDQPQPAHPVHHGHPGHHHGNVRSVPVAPAMVVEVQPTTVRRGYELVVAPRPFQQNLNVYLNGRLVVRRLSPSGDSYVVLIPANADSGYIEVEWNGQRYRSGYITVTP